MAGRKIIIGEPIKFGLRTLVQQISLLAIVVLVGSAISAAVLSSVYLFNEDFLKAIAEASALQDLQQMRELIREHIPTILVSVIISFLVFTGLYLGLNKIALELCDRGKSSVKKLFSGFRLAPRAVAALILYVIAVLAGTVLFVLPGIFIGIRFALFPYCIIDHNAGVIESLKMSYNITRNHGWNLFLLGTVVNLIAYIPKLLILFLGPIGWISYAFTTPFSALVHAYFYRSLVPQQNNRLSDAA